MLCSNKFFLGSLLFESWGGGRERERDRLTIWAECFLNCQKASKMHELAVLTVSPRQVRPSGSLRLTSAHPRMAESHLTPYKKPQDGDMVRPGQKNAFQFVESTIAG